ncbi:MAG: hypothetical protein GEU81_15030 [Nitriliruptorales bacterium]|nr:hypothetical protein [Nitriliruptorales bacterium]
MGDDAVQQHVHEGKASFDHLYDLPDPRPLFRALAPLGYRIPHHGQPLFSFLLAEQRRDNGHGPLTVHRPLTVLDVCCSYGINAALLKHDLTLKDLYERYSTEELDGLSAEELAEADRAFFAERRSSAGLRVIGLDTAGSAIGYALRAGLLDGGFGENLEHDEPSPELTGALRAVDLITVSGGVGYLSARTFDRLLAATRGRSPWVATFPLRTVDYAPIAEALARYGLVTEHWAGRTFPQRAFVSAQERRFAVRGVRERGLDPAGKEADGEFHADFYLSRPADDAAALPIDRLLASLDA